MSQTIHGERRDSREAVAEADSLLSRDTPRNSATVSRHVAHGTIWTLGGRVAGLSASFVSTPFLTRLLSAEQYGIWALADTVTAYLTFTNMGMGAASTRFAAKPYTRKDAAGEVAVVWTSLLITLIPAVVGVLAVVLAAAPLVGEVFGVPKHLQTDAVMVVRLTALGFVFRIFAEVFNTSQLVRLRLDLYASVNTGLLILQHGAVVIALLLGGGLRGAVWIVALCGLLTALTHAFASRTLQPALFRPRIDATLLRPLLRFGSSIVLINLMGFVLVNFERLFLAHFSSVQDLAYYSIAAKLTALVTLVATSMSQPLLPALSALHATNDKVLLERLCSQAVRAIVLCVLPMVLMLCIIAEPLLRLWAGPEYAMHSTVLLYILMAGAVFNSMAVVPYNLLTAAGRTGAIARCTVVELIPYLIYAYFLCSQFGPVGAALTWSLRMLIHPILLFAAARKVVGLPVRLLTGNWLSGGMALLILVSAAAASSCFGSNPFVRATMAAAGCVGFYAVVWAKVLSPGERKRLLQILHLGA